MAHLGTANGTPLQRWDCNGTGAQKFVFNAAGQLLNTNSNKCVDVPYSNSTNGTQLCIYDCNVTNAQRWYVR